MVRAGLSWTFNRGLGAMFSVHSARAARTSANAGGRLRVALKGRPMLLEMRPGITGHGAERRQDGVERATAVVLEVQVRAEIGDQTGLQI